MNEHGAHNAILREFPRAIDLIDEVIRLRAEVARYEEILRPARPHGVLEDGFGSVWPLCRADCQIQVVRPGKVQCECDACTFATDCPACVHVDECPRYAEEDA